MIKIVQRSPNASRSPAGAAADCDIAQSPDSSSGINPTGGPIRLVQKQNIPVKRINFVTVNKNGAAAS